MPWLKWLQPTSSISELLWPKVSGEQFKNELRRWSSLSFLSGIGAFSDMAPWLISLIMIGHVSTVELAALGLIEVWLYSFLEVIWSGIGLTESVFVSQAHGKKNLLAMRGWAFISVIVMTFGNVIITVLCVTAAPTLKAFGLDPTLCDIGQVYAYYIIPAMFIEGFNICAATYLCSVQAPRIPTFIHLFGVFIDIPVSYFFIFGKGDKDKFISNALVGSALGWIFSAGFVMLLNIGAVAYLWGKELEYGDNDQVEDDTDGDIILRGDSKTKKAAQHEHLQLAPALASDGDNIPRSKSLGGGGFGVGFRKNSGIQTVLSTTLAIQSAAAPGRDRTTTGGSARSRATTGESQGMYARLLSAGSRLGGGDDDDDDESDDSEEKNADASLPSVIQWSKNRHRWRVYSCQAVPNCFTVLLQCCVFTVLSFMAANLGTVEIAAHNQNIALLEVAFTFVSGMAEGTSIRVGYHVGRGNVECAKLVTQIAFAVNATVGILVGLLGYYFRFELASCLSSDPDVVALSVQLAPILWGTFALFSIGDQALGVLEGQGRAVAQAVAFFIGAVGVTIPLAFLSFFTTDYGLVGLWYALLIGFLLSEIIGLVLVLWYSNWEQAVQDAINRIEADAQASKHGEQDDDDAEWHTKIIQIKKTSSRDTTEEPGSMLN